MTQRAPIYTKIGPREFPKGLLTWTNGIPLGIQPTAAIQRQQDWPNPRPRTQNLELRTWTNQLPPGAIAQVVAKPPSQLLWDNPRRAAFPIDLRGWFNWQQLDNGPSAFIPNTDWPNPRPKRQNLELRTWSNGLPPGVLANQLPPVRNYDWPNPRLRVDAPQLRTWINGVQLQAQALPFTQTDWKNPPRRRDTIELRTWTNGLPPGVLANQLPPNEWREWPNPLPKAPNLELRQWSNGLPPGVIANQLPPVRQHALPNPLPRPYNLELRSWTTGYSAIYQPEIAPYVEDTRVIVPYLIGSTAAQATAQLASVHLLVATVGITGTVTAQDVAAFTAVARGTTVTITLGGAPNHPKKNRLGGLPNYTLPN